MDGALVPVPIRIKPAPIWIAVILHGIRERHVRKRRISVRGSEPVVRPAINVIRCAVRKGAHRVPHRKGRVSGIRRHGIRRRSAHRKRARLVGAVWVRAARVRRDRAVVVVPVLIIPVLIIIVRRRRTETGVRHLRRDCRSRQSGDHESRRQQFRDADSCRRLFHESFPRSAI